MCVRNAIKSTNVKYKISQFYCTFGKICIVKKNAKRVQHCFIRAIQLDRHNAVAWCSLALLYIKLNLVVIRLYICFVCVLLFYLDR